MKDNALEVMLDHIKRRFEPYAAISVTLLEEGLVQNDRKHQEAEIRAVIDGDRHSPLPIPKP